jgi:hypothetical protein
VVQQRQPPPPTIRVLFPTTAQQNWTLSAVLFVSDTSFRSFDSLRFTLVTRYSFVALHWFSIWWLPHSDTATSTHTDDGQTLFFVLLFLLQQQHTRTGIDPVRSLQQQHSYRSRPIDRIISVPSFRFPFACCLSSFTLVTFPTRTCNNEAL